MYAYIFVPPRCVSPPVALTSKIPSSIVSNDTSKVPPPKSKISTYLLTCIRDMTHMYERHDSSTTLGVSTISTYLKENRNIGR